MSFKNYSIKTQFSEVAIGQQFFYYGYMWQRIKPVEVRGNMCNAKMVNAAPNLFDMGRFNDTDTVYVTQVGQLPGMSCEP